MLIFTLKKMLRNKWMVSCLLLGAIFFAAVLSVIPTYSNGVYMFMIHRSLAEQQIRTGRHLGNWFLSIDIKERGIDLSETFARAREIERLVEEHYIPDMGLPVLASRKQYALDGFYFFRRGTNASQIATILGVEGFWDHVDIVAGRKSNQTSSNENNGVLEFVMSRVDYQRTAVNLGEEFDLFSYVLPLDANRKFGSAICVGIYEPRYEEPFWFSDQGFDSPTFILDFDYFKERFVEPETNLVSTLSFYYCLDYSQIRPGDVENILNTTSRVRYDRQGFGSLQFPMAIELQRYLGQRDSFEFVLLIFIIPLLVLLVFFIYMVSKLMINYESNEIAVLKSRGARNTQIFSVYALMSFIIAGAAFLTGPLLGLLIARVLGLSNGFMEFVYRHGMRIELSSAAYIYAGCAAVLFIIVMLIPALQASRDTIVKSKQKKSRRISVPLWQKLCLDIILIGISLYALHLYSANAELRSIINISGEAAPVDPLVLLASSVFVLGAGLVFLRLFPLVVKLIFLIGKNIWPPMLFSTLLSISRFKGSSQFLALFLIFNIGVGLFSATAARTINRFLEDRVSYDIGADVTLTQVWPSEEIFYRVEFDGGITRFERIPTPPPDLPLPVGVVSGMKLWEPPFSTFEHLEGVELATKVFRNDEANISSGFRANATSVFMAIIPHEFGQVAWMREGLLPVHINHYLNVMTADRSAVLVSSELRQFLRLSIGDHIRIGWAEQFGNIYGTVYGFVDYWPSIHAIEHPYFVIANLDTMHHQMRVEPYSVWLGLEDGVTSHGFRQTIDEAGIRLRELRDTNQEVIRLKNDPLLQGMNGSLTLGFLITLAITFIGYIIYWVLSIKSRLLQFGILRAIGLTRGGLISALMWEQVFVSGSAIAAGFGIGILANRLYVPILQMIYTPAELMPPFLITASFADYTTLLAAFGAMLIVGMSILIVMIKRLKPDQVLKLGED